MNREDKILELIDGTLDAEEQRKLEKEIENSHELKRKYELLKNIHNSLEKARVDYPSVDFTERVMRDLEGSSHRYRNGFFGSLHGIFLIVALGIAMVFTLLALGVEGGGGSSGPFGYLTELAPAQELNILERIQLPSKYIINLGMAVLAISGLLALDTFVLRQKPSGNIRLFSF